MDASLSGLALAARSQVGTPYYGLVWLALAQLTYTDESAAVIGDVNTALPAAVAALPPLPAPPGMTASGDWCSWRVEWGPCVTGDNSNLMFVATCRDTASGLPIVSAICIRGTDTKEKGKLRGLLQELYEDLDVGQKVPWTSVMDDPGSPCSNGAAATDVAIAKGTCEGLKTLRMMSSGGLDILAFVSQFASTNPAVPLVVTGHSLGGCQTTVMAAFLGDALALSGVATTIVPHAFAPPTAGTQGFAAKFAAQFPNGHLWWNTLDIVPNAFQNIAGAPPDTPSMTHMPGFWQDHGGPGANLIEKLAIEAFIREEHSYGQPAANLITLAGSVVPPDASAKDDWTSQIFAQHLCPRYHTLISTQMAATVAAYPLPQPG
jgi:hypothetical protein